ncbi:tetratricopeptide repeat protein [Desulfonatronovibrio magnus]|uniref:tetratricopeptide repeat protein n=1 Tax=Desulfonatronovibrio magnus TaxID=698827 RepID=UPI0005EBCE0B|nr:tetratricopeptide repeat protein [Desulfonatronovibrio magnus]
MNKKNFLLKYGNSVSIFFLIMSGIAVYSNSFSVPFVLDDIRSIVENSFIKSFEGFASLEVFERNRPLVDLTFALNYHFGELRVFGYHLVNLLIHIINGIMVYFLILLIHSRISSKYQIVDGYRDDLWLVRYVALFTALIFVVHPLQTQAVTYIVQRYTSMAALFYILSVLLYILGRNRQVSGSNDSLSYVFISFSFLSGLMAFFSKQNAASLPAVILLIEFLLYKNKWSEWKKKLYWILPAIAGFVLIVLFNIGFFSGQGDFSRLLEDVSSLMRETTEISRWEYLVTQFVVVSKYLIMYMFPVGQNIDHMHPVLSGFWSGWAPLGSLLLLALLIAGFCFLKKQAVVSFAIFWFFITLSVESSVLPISDTMFEHRLYLPMIGPALATALIASQWLIKYPRIVLSLSLCYIIILGIFTFERNKVWQSQVTIWEDSIKKNPENFRAHTSLALAFEDQGEKGKALKHYNRALSIQPDYGFAHLNLGALLGEMGRIEEAEKHFRSALKEIPNNASLLNNLGVNIAIQGNLSKAEKYFRRSLRIDDQHIGARFNLAITLLNMNKSNQAMEELEYILKIDPANADALEMLEMARRFSAGQ